MTLAVADRSSNKPEQIEHAAEVIGRSAKRARLFREIYRGKSKLKTVPALMKKTGFTRIRVLDLGKQLADNALVTQTRVDCVTAYEKVPFLQRYRDRILRLATNPTARQALPTKRRPSSPRTGSTVRVNLDLRLPRKLAQAKQIMVDDIDSFARVRKIKASQPPVQMLESRFKKGVARILGERGTFNDWGGELRDLSSTRLVFKNKRRATAFAFKGPGTKGRLTPGKLGKNGDQIQRLTRCPAEIFLIQYWNEIDDSVLDQLERLVQVKAFFERKSLSYGIIDGQDSARLIAAYPQHFEKN